MLKQRVLMVFLGCVAGCGEGRSLAVEREAVADEQALSTLNARPPWRDSILGLTLGKWKIRATFTLPDGQHAETSDYDVSPEGEFDRHNPWLIGIYDGRRDNGTKQQFRFNVRVDPATLHPLLVVFGDAGDRGGVVFTAQGVESGDPRTGGTVTWTGSVGGIPLVEVWTIEKDKFTFEDYTPDLNGLKVNWGTATRH